MADIILSSSSGIQSIDNLGRIISSIYYNYSKSIDVRIADMNSLYNGTYSDGVNNYLYPSDTITKVKMKSGIYHQIISLTASQNSSNPFVKELNKGNVNGQTWIQRMDIWIVQNPTYQDKYNQVKNSTSNYSMDDFNRSLLAIVSRTSTSNEQFNQQKTDINNLAITDTDQTEINNKNTQKQNAISSIENKWVAWLKSLSESNDADRGSKITTMTQVVNNNWIADQNYIQQIKDELVRLQNIGDADKSFNTRLSNLIVTNNDRNEVDVIKDLQDKTKIDATTFNQQTLIQNNIHNLIDQALKNNDQLFNDNNKTVRAISYLAGIANLLTKTNLPTDDVDNILSSEKIHAINNEATAELNIINKIYDTTTLSVDDKKSRLTDLKPNLKTDQAKTLIDTKLLALNSLPDGTGGDAIDIIINDKSKSDDQKLDALLALTPDSSLQTKYNTTLKTLIGTMVDNASKDFSKNPDDVHSKIVAISNKIDGKFNDAGITTKITNNLINVEEVMYYNIFNSGDEKTVTGLQAKISNCDKYLAIYVVEKEKTKLNGLKTKYQDNLAKLNGGQIPNNVAKWMFNDNLYGSKPMVFSPTSVDYNQMEEYFKLASESYVDDDFKARLYTIMNDFLDLVPTIMENKKQLLGGANVNLDEKAPEWKQGIINLAKRIRTDYDKAGHAEIQRVRDWE